MTKIRKPADLKTQANIKALLYGQPGIGKTTMALSAPAPLLIDCDGGVHRINPAHQTATVQVESWNDVTEVLGEDLSDYKTIVFDTVGKLLDYMSAHLIATDPKMGQKDGSLQLKGYGARKVMFINLIKQVSIMGKNIVFVAHDKEEKDGEIRIVRPEIGGSSAGDLIKELDLVGYMEMIGKKRTVSFDPCEKYYGKNTCGLAAQMEIPDAMTAGNLFMTQIIAKYGESLAAKQVMLADYSELMEVITSTIESVTDIEQANEAAGKFSAMPHIWDSKLQSGRALNAKAKELGLSWNVTKKTYEAKV